MSFLLRKIGSIYHFRRMPQQMVFVIRDKTSKPSIEQMFTEKESMQILSKLNSASQEELLDYPEISESMADSMVTGRKAMPFSSLDELSTLKGIGPTKILRMGKSILEQPTLSAEKKIRKFIHPPYTYPGIPDSVIALSVKLPFLFWVHVNSVFQVEHMGREEVFEEKKFNQVASQNRLWNIISSFPQVDVYLVEELTRTKKSQNFLTGSIKTDIMLTTMLNCTAMARDSNNGPVFQHRVHRITYSYLLRHFNLLVAGERLSCVGVINRLLLGSHEGIHLQCDQSIKTQLHQLTSTEQEHIGYCLLQAVLFYKLLAKK